MKTAKNNFNMQRKTKFLSFAFEIGKFLKKVENCENPFDTSSLTIAKKRLTKLNQSQTYERYENSEKRSNKQFDNCKKPFDKIKPISNIRKV